jgi:hypothetical protein
MNQPSAGALHSKITFPCEGVGPRDRQAAHMSTRARRVIIFQEVIEQRMDSPEGTDSAMTLAFLSAHGGAR